MQDHDKIKVVLNNSLIFYNISPYLVKSNKQLNNYNHNFIFYFNIQYFPLI